MTEVTMIENAKNSIEGVTATMVLEKTSKGILRTGMGRFGARVLIHPILVSTIFKWPHLVQRLKNGNFLLVGGNDAFVLKGSKEADRIYEKMSEELSDFTFCINKESYYHDLSQLNNIKVIDKLERRLN